LPAGTTTNPTIVEFPQSACYQVNGTLYFWGFENFWFTGGRFQQNTDGKGELTRACSSGCYYSNDNDSTWTTSSTLVTTATAGGYVNVYTGQDVTGSGLSGIVSHLWATSGGTGSCDEVTTPCVALTLSSTPTAAVSAGRINFGQYSEAVGALGTGSNGNSPNSQAMCLTNATGPTDGSAGNPPNTYPSPAGTQPIDQAFKFNFFMWFEGGCNDVVQNMTIIGAGSMGAVEEENTLITFAGTYRGVVSGVSIDGPNGDCVDAQGLHEGGGGSPLAAQNITVTNNLCVNAGRDGFSAIEARSVAWTNNLIYYPNIDVIDVEYDNATQAGKQQDIAFNNNTVDDGLEGRGSGVVFTAQTDSPTYRMSVNDNTINEALSVIVKDLLVTYPIGQFGVTGTIANTGGVAVVTGPSGSFTQANGYFVGGYVTDANGWLCNPSIACPSGFPGPQITAMTGTTLTLNSAATSTGADTVIYTNKPDPGSTGSDLSVAGNVFTQANSGSGGTNGIVFDVGVGPLYVYQNKGPNYSTSTPFVRSGAISPDYWCTYYGNGGGTYGTGVACPAPQLGQVVDNDVTSGISAASDLVAGNASNLTCGNTNNGSPFSPPDNNCSGVPIMIPAAPAVPSLPISFGLPLHPIRVVVGVLPCIPGNNNTTGCPTSW
jgi:hypothetical protein